jgi:transposase
MERAEVVEGAEQSQQVRPEPVVEPARRQGETPRQQMRKAKTVTRRRFSAEEKIRIVMEGIRGEEPVSAICRREGIQSTVYYRWLKDFMEAGKRRLRGDTLREAGRDEVQALQQENARLKQLVADYALELMVLKKISSEL